jgi:hypothetical protein
MRIVVLTVSLILASCDLWAQPAVHRAKVSAVPDFLQTDRDAGFAKSGSQFCAPAAVSNSLMWLADHGYRNLRPSGSAKAAQIAMIRKLSGPRFMKTSPSIGTDVTQVLTGVETYIAEAGYSISELKYEGWRPVPRGVVSSKYPDLGDIKAAVADDRRAAWLNVGWYSYDEESGDYVRSGGHWVTVVGYDHDDLLIHDPSPAAGAGFRTQRVTLEELTEGRLSGQQRNLPRSAKGYYEAGGEMAVASGKTCILDGVVLLTLE